MNKDMIAIIVTIFITPLHCLYYYYYDIWNSGHHFVNFKGKCHPGKPHSVM